MTHAREPLFETLNSFRIETERLYVGVAPAEGWISDITSTLEVIFFWAARTPKQTGCLHDVNTNVCWANKEKQDLMEPSLICRQCQVTIWRWSEDVPHWISSKSMWVSCKLQASRASNCVQDVEKEVQNVTSEKESLSFCSLFFFNCEEANNVHVHFHHQPPGAHKHFACKVVIIRTGTLIAVSCAWQQRPCLKVCWWTCTLTRTAS